MRCPACRTPANESDAACRQCGFSMEAADRVFGIAPMLEPPICDIAGELSTFAQRKAERVIADLVRRFPQVAVAVVLTEVPPQAPLAAYAFWMFNRSQLSSEVEKGGENRLVMLLIDASTNRAVAMVGYGLEPFIRDEQLQSCLQAARQALQRGQYGQVVEAFTRELERRLTELSQLLPQQFGLVQETKWLDASAEGENFLEPQESLF